jgi:hypothetical protein
LILPNIKFAILRSQCDSYIRFFEAKVKKKMHIASGGPGRPRPGQSIKPFLV